MATGSLLFGVLALNLLLGVYSQWVFDPPKKEGEECGLSGSEVWTCQREPQCPSLRKLIRTGNRIICSKDGGINAVCCPPSPSVTSISQKKCMEYQALGTCKSRPVVLVGASGGPRLPPFPGAVLEESIAKVKRQVDTMDPEDLYATVGPDDQDEPFRLEDQDTPVGRNGTTEPDVSIHGGVEALAGEHPHMALIGYGVARISWQCGGSLISERFVLSAAHCEHGSMGPARMVRLGDLDYNNIADDENVQQFRIIETYKHKDYKNPQLYNDIVLYKLDQDAFFNQFVAPACLYPGVAEAKGLATITGFGKVERQLRKSVLMKANLNFVDTEKCNNHYKSRGFNKNIHSGIDGKTILCAWAAGKDSCSDDSSPREGAITRFARGAFIARAAPGSSTNSRCKVKGIRMFRFPKTNTQVWVQNSDEECHREDGREWFCRKVSDCTSSRRVIQGGGTLKTCSWKNAHTHIVCCPPEDEKQPYTNSISQQKCEEYNALLCRNTLYQGPPVRPNLVPVTNEDKPTSFGRTRRQTTTKPLVFFAIGGTNAIARETPHMTEGALPRGFEEDDRGTFAIASIGGEDAQPKEHPHMALIGFGNPGTISWQCGGSLISERFVLSAAHCSNTGYGLARWARLGDLDISSDKDDAQPQQFEIIERIVHSGYKAPAYYNDIVLFRLDRDALFDQYVGPVCLHSSREDPTGVGIATGWGKNETNGPRSKALVKVYLKFIPTEECKRKIGKIEPNLSQGLDSRTMMCAGEPGKDTCQGDSGGPLVLSERNGKCLARQVGVTSFGPKNCGRSHVTGTYVRVAHFLSWIESVVWPQ